jgi:hypothetical protein
VRFSPWAAYACGVCPSVMGYMWVKRLAPFERSGRNWLIIDQHAEVIAAMRSSLEEGGI